MAQVYSTVFDGFVIAGPAVHDTILDIGFVWVLREIDAQVVCSGGAGDQLTISVDGIAIAAWAIPATYQGVVSWRGRQVMPGPSTISTVLSSSSASASVRMSGYRLSLP